MDNSNSEKKRPATMHEIARQLGVSIATVSRALNDQPGVGASMRERVHELSAKLNYVPHSGARGLVTTQTHTVAFLTAHRALALEADTSYQRLMMGAQQELIRHNYYLLIATLRPEQLNDLPNLPLLLESRLDGMILAGPEISPRHILALQARRIPLVLVDNTLPHTAVDAVVSEDDQGGYSATTHLLDHGHERIAVLTGPLDWPSNQARYQGYRRAMAERGLEILEIHEDETTIESGQRAMQDARQAFPNLSAIFAVNDSMAIGAMRTVRAAGLSVPGDIAVVGFDDIEWASHVDPPLTTVKIYKRQMGTVAAQRLVQLMTDQAGAPVRSVVATTLIIRASCGCA
jgi:LacI family transcriptional regulator